MNIRSLIVIILMAKAGPVLAGQSGHCEFKVTGDLTLSVSSKVAADVESSKSRGTTDYWVSKTGGPGTAPIRNFSVRCGSDDGSVLIAIVPNTTQAQVPLKPARYKVIYFNGNQPGGQFYAQLTAKMDSPMGKMDRLWEVSAPGSIEFTQLDTKGMTGKFVFKARETAGQGKISVTGSFSFSCEGSSCN
jgi:hypothetical protein